VLVIMSIQSHAPTSMGSGGRDSPISIWTNENIEVGQRPEGPERLSDPGRWKRTGGLSMLGFALVRH
jgi:hypothetical protein